MIVLPIPLTGFLAGLGPLSGPVDDGDGRHWADDTGRANIINRATRPFTGQRPAGTARPGPTMAADPHNNRSDEQLLEDYLAGDRPAFRELMERYRNELSHFLTRFLGSRAAADDVFQETFLQVHLSCETFDTTRRFRPWLFTIAANKARDYHRKNTRRRPLSLLASIGAEGEGQSFVDLLKADLPSPDQPLADAERSRLIRDVVDAMPANLREILLLSYFQKMSYNQVADSLGIPLGTVKSRLHTAVATFARSWSAARAVQSNRPGEDKE